MAYTLWDKFLKHNPKNPKWFNRDRFVLSAGHGCMLLYALLHLTGYDSVTIDDIKQFRQWGSKTPGHPETFETAGVEVTTGPLGQGIANAVGLAMAEAHLAAKFNKPDCTHILFWDDDMGFEPALVEAMLAQDKDVVGVVSPKRAIDLGRLHGQHDQAFTAAYARACDFIGKPFDIIDLRKKVARAFDLVAKRASSSTPTA